MQVLKVILAIMLLAVALVFGIGQVLSDRVHMERRITVNAPSGEIFALLNSPQQYTTWSPWFSKDPNVELRFDGPVAGQGAKVSWWSEQKDVGSGSETILESQENQFVRTRLDFGAQTASATFMLEATAEGTRVVWGFYGDCEGDLVCRYIGLLLDHMMGPNYEAGLRNIKRLAEN